MAVCAALLQYVALQQPAAAQIAPGSPDLHWNEGAEDCKLHGSEPLQVQRYDAATFLLREDLCATFEANVSAARIRAGAADR
jgi:hypothetical protein